MHVYIAYIRQDNFANTRIGNAFMAVSTPLQVLLRDYRGATPFAHSPLPSWAGTQATVPWALEYIEMSQLLPEAWLQDACL